MHWTLLIAFTKDLAETSFAAREHAFNQLLGDRSFLDVDGGGAIADRIEIGGRASGLLRRAKDPIPLETPRAPGRPVIDPTALPHDLIDRLGTELGEEDDAMVVDAALYKALLRPFEGLNRAYGGDLPVFLDLDGDPVSQDAYVGLKWLVVVDCHTYRALRGWLSASFRKCGSLRWL